MLCFVKAQKLPNVQVTGSLFGPFGPNKGPGAHVAKLEMLVRHMVRVLYQSRFEHHSSRFSTRIQDVNERLRQSIEGAHNVVDSANTSQLEQEPASREPRIETLLRYQRFALDDMAMSLKQHELALQEIEGESEKRSAEARLAPAVQECLLVRGQLLKDVLEAENAIKVMESWKNPSNVS